MTIWILTNVKNKCEYCCYDFKLIFSSALLTYCYCLLRLWGCFDYYV